MIKSNYPNNESRRKKISTFPLTLFFRKMNSFLPNDISPQFLCIVIELKYFSNPKLFRVDVIFLISVMSENSRSWKHVCAFFFPMTNPCLFSMKLMSEKYYIFSVGNRRLPSTILVRTLYPFNHPFHFSALKFPLPRTTS